MLFVRQKYHNEALAFLEKVGIIYYSETHEGSC